MCAGKLVYGADRKPIGLLNEYSATRSSPFMMIASVSLMPSPMAPATGPLIRPIMRHVSPWPYSWYTMSASRSPSTDSGCTSASLTVALTPALERSVAPSSCPTNTTPIVTVASVPPITSRPSPELFATIAAVAPAFWAFFALMVKLHVPRSIKRDFSGHRPGRHRLARIGCRRPFRR